MLLSTCTTLRFTAPSLFLVSLSSLLHNAHICAHHSTCSLVPRVLRTYSVECHQASTAKLSLSLCPLSVDRAPLRLFFQDQDPSPARFSSKYTSRLFHHARSLCTIHRKRYPQLKPSLTKTPRATSKSDPPALLCFFTASAPKALVHTQIRKFLSPRHNMTPLALVYFTMCSHAAHTSNLF